MPASPSLPPFKLSVQLQGHSGDVRAVAAHTTSSGSSLVLSASRDTTACVWARQKGTRYFQPPQVLGGHGGYVNSCHWLAQEESGELFALTGGQDKLVNAFQVSLDAQGMVTTSNTPDYSLIGHEDNVSALDVGPEGAYIVSGSWDKTAKVWKGWECVATLKGHLQAVWAVLAVDKDRIITASADKIIRLWSISQPADPIAVFGGHGDAVRGLTLLEGRKSFASCSNDGTINVYSLESLDPRGANMPRRTLSGHTSFVYSLATLSPSHELVSSGEDRSVRIWNGSSAVQTLTIPAISIWSVVTLADGDLICGSSDHQIRVFTRQSERVADKDDLEAYERNIASQALNKTQVGDIRKDDVPGVEALAQPGSKEGQTKMVSSNGVIEAHQWSMSGQRWEKIGEVVGGVGAGQKKLHQGKEYDYVFDVDIADGVPPLKLPYNLNENAYAAAQKFLDQNELPMTYLEQVVAFIDKNIEGATIGSGGSEGYVDPFSGTGRYIPGSGIATSGSAGPQSSTGGQTLPPSLKIIPQKAYLSFKQANLTALEAKLTELNTSATPPVNATSVLSALRGSSESIDVSPLFEALLAWPVAARLPLLDICRLAALQGTTTAVSDFISKLLDSAEWSSQLPSKAKEVNTMLAARGIANLFTSSSVRQEVIKEAESVLSGLDSGDFSSLNKNGRVAFATIIYNFSVAVTSSSQVQSYAASILNVVVKILTQEDGDSEVIYRTLIALGNLLVSSSAKELQVGHIQLARDAAQAWGSRLGSGEERVRVVVDDLKSLTV